MATAAATTTAARHTRRIFSGIQPTGIPHLGNYLGAIREWVKLQPDTAALPTAEAATTAAVDPSSVLYCIVDLHAMTMPYDARLLRESCLATSAVLIACGIDPERSTLFRQSAVREHAELAWLLSCLTPLGWLQRMTQFKQKGSGARDRACLGLLSYPVLQAADILLYRSTHVPVGEDQHQHLELARDIAAAFNQRFASGLRPGQGSADVGASGGGLSCAGYFPLPETLSLAKTGEGGGAAASPFEPGADAPLVSATPSSLDTSGARIMSLRDGTKKMSKSDPDDSSRINLTDSADAIRDKIKRAKTDAVPGFSYDPAGRPDKSNLLAIFSAVTGTPLGAVVDRFGASSASAFKAELTEAVVSTVSPISREVRRLLGVTPGDEFAAGSPASFVSGGGSHLAELEGLLHQGERRAGALAAQVMRDVRKLTGAQP